ncbi:MAG: hypothetical protein PHS34_08280 [Candidatus Omnitrophica bacterium]|nr:hypothetical protein [Candidatus Omnitrophota bacterium]
MPDSTLSTLQQINTKVRRLTRSPSTAQLTDDAIKDYVNTFVLYDFPSHLKTFELRTTIEFFTQPYVDQYQSNDIVTNFKNLFPSVYSNMYVNGYKQFFTQSREEFFQLYPQISNVVQIATGDNVTTNFTGYLNALNTTPTSGITFPALRNSISFISATTSLVGLYMYDVPNSPNDGSGTFSGNVAVPGTINYYNGAYNITFSTPPGTGQKINSQFVSSSPGRPYAVLYYNDVFTFRPVPDSIYRVSLEVEQRPSELLQNASIPELSQWWQYIAYGAAKKIFEDRMDMESVQKIMPEFKQQEALVIRRTVDTQSKERSSTIYTDTFTELRGFFK